MALSAIIYIHIYIYLFIFIYIYIYIWVGVTTHHHSVLTLQTPRDTTGTLSAEGLPVLRGKGSSRFPSTPLGLHFLLFPFTLESHLAGLDWLSPLIHFSSSENRKCRHDALGKRKLGGSGGGRPRPRSTEQNWGRVSFSALGLRPQLSPCWASRD